MKKPKIEKRVINIPLKDFQSMKNFCDAHCLNLPKWLVSLAKEAVWQDMKAQMIEMGLPMPSNEQERLLMKSQLEASKTAKE